MLTLYLQSNLEMELRLQQFIELARTGSMPQLLDAILHARKHLIGSQDAEFVLRAGGLLAHPPDTPVQRYRELYDPTRYARLADQFLETHHQLFSLPVQPLLNIALSAGLSALKTPTCHSEYASYVSGPVCPICSTELNELARGVPYAHHTKSHIEEDPVVLPNGRVYGRERLTRYCEKVGCARGKVRDPGEVYGSQWCGVEWGEEEVRKVFIS